MKHEKELKRKRARDKEIKAQLIKNENQANGLGGTTPRGQLANNRGGGSDSDATQVYPYNNAADTPLQSEKDGTNAIDLSGIILQSSLSSFDGHQLGNIKVEA